MLFSFWDFNNLFLSWSRMRISFRISLLNHGLSFSLINIVFEGIHALEIWRNIFENSSHISSTSSKLQSLSFQFISVSIWLNLTKSVWSYNQISLVNDFDVAFGHLMNAIAASWSLYMSWYSKYIRIITVHDRFWNVGQTNCILKYFENMIDHSDSTIF